MQVSEYKVRLEAFEGPLDLLLYLIRKDEVDIHDIPIARITEQYLAHVRELDDGHGLDLDVAGDFLVMAATLMEIKSRMLAPAPEAGADAARPRAHADPRTELVQQLLAYRRYRDAADALERRAEDWTHRVAISPTGLPDGDDPAGLEHADEHLADDPGVAAALEKAQAEATDVEDLELVDIVEAFRRVAETVNFERLGEHQVTYDDTPVELHAEDLHDRLRRDAGPDREIELTSVFTGRTRAEMVGLFLAMLHLVARRHVGVRQDRASGVIFLRLLPDDGAQSAADPANGDLPATPHEPHE